VKSTASTAKSVPALSVVRNAGWFPVAAEPGDSDPDMDEALRRATTEVTYLQQEQVIAEQVEAAYAEYEDQPKVEYREYAASVAA
jgi:hypothetical protein